jgi:phenylacetate-CoA ligase
MRPRYTIRRLRDVKRALAIARRLAEQERWSREELLEFQRDRLSSLVRHAVQHSPFYRDLYARERLPSDGSIELVRLPLLTKAGVMENFDRIVTDPRLRLAALDDHVAGLTRDDYYLGEYRVLTTSGSTGGRALFVYDPREWSTSLAGFLRYASFMESSPCLPRRIKVAAIGAPGALHQSNRVATSLDVGLYRMLRLPVTASIPELVAALNAFQPEALNAYPSIATLLAAEQLDGRLDIHPLRVSTSSEVRTEEMERAIREAWAVEPFNMYAASETGMLAVDCSHHRGLHLFDDLSILEVVDEDGQPVPAGSPGHKLLLTNLFNYTQPLIRYEISDMLTLNPEPCPCGRPFRLVRTIEGRNDDILYLPTPNGRRIPVHPIHLRSPLGADASVRQYQVVHDAAGLHVRLVLANGASPEASCAQARDTLLGKLAALGVAPLHVDVRPVPALEREGGPAGKFKLVKSNLAAAGSGRQ